MGKIIKAVAGCVLVFQLQAPAVWKAATAGTLTADAVDTQTLTLPSGFSGETVLSLGQPQPVSEDTARLRLWASNGSRISGMNYLIRDASGALHEVKAVAGFRTSFTDETGALIRQSGWGLFESVLLQETADIESRAVPSFAAKLAAARRPRPWVLEGLKITVRPSARGSDKIALTVPSAVETDGLRARYNWVLHDRERWGWNVNPVLFPDDLTGAAGNWLMGVEIRQGYGGPVVYESYKSVTIKEDDAAGLYEQRFELPELPKGRYFIETRTFSDFGVLVRREAQILTVAKGSGTAAPVDPLFRWKTGAENNVFPADTTEAVIRFMVSDRFLKRHPNHRPDWTFSIYDWLKRPVPFTSLVSTNADGSLTFTLSVSGLTESCDYLLDAEAQFNGKPREFRQLHFGVQSRTETLAGKTVPASVPDARTLFHGHKPVLLGEWQMHAPEKYDGTHLQQPERFLRFMEDVKAKGFTHSSAVLLWGDLEPLPGVFRWEGVDGWLKKAEEQGTPMFLLLGVTSYYHRIPMWVDLDPQLDQFGYLSDGRHRTDFWFSRETVFDQAYKKAWHELLTRLFSRYLDHPAFAGVRLRSVEYGDVAIPEAAQRDYSESSQKAFAEWLAARGLTPRPLPARRYLSGEGRTSFGPDLSEDWQLFHEFRTENHDRVIEEMLQAIRAVDPIRPIGFYRGPRPGAFEHALPVLAKYNAFFHDEGGPGYMASALASMCSLYQVPYTYESHRYIPPSKRMMDAALFYGGLYSSGMNWLFRYHADGYGRAGSPDMAGATEHLRESVPALRVWASGDPVDSGALILGSRLSNLLSGFRLGFYSHISGISLFQNLFTQSQYPAAFATDCAPDLDFNRYKVILVEGEVVDDATGAKLESYAKTGGRILLRSDAGTFCPQKPEETDVLAKRLSPFSNVRNFNDLDEKTVQWISEAGAVQRIRTLNPGFHVYLKTLPDGRLLAAVFRPYTSDYGELWFDSKESSDGYFNRMKELGRGEVHASGNPRPYVENIAAPQVEVSGLVPGQGYRLTQIHRTGKDLGLLTADTDGVVSFLLDPVNTGFLQMVEIYPE